MGWPFPNWRKSHPVHDRINQVFKDVPQWFLYIRFDERFKIAADWSPQSQDGPSSGSESLTSGEKATLEIVPGRLVRGGNQGQQDGPYPENPGLLDKEVETLHVPKEVFPKVSDIVCAVEWNKDSYSLPTQNVRPMRIYEAWRIREVEWAYEVENAWAIVALDPYSIVLDTLREEMPSWERFTFVQMDQAKWQKSYW
jgi:hypothetical protein